MNIYPKYSHINGIFFVECFRAIFILNVKVLCVNYLNLKGVLFLGLSRLNGICFLSRPLIVNKSITEIPWWGLCYKVEWVTVSLFIMYWHFMVMRRAIWYHLYNLKNVKSTHGGVLLLVKLQASTCKFTKSNTPPWMFFTIFKLCKWYQIVQRITFIHTVFLVGIAIADF